MDFDAQRKMTFLMQLTSRDRKGCNLQSGNLQLWALFILLTHLNFSVEFQCQHSGKTQGCHETVRKTGREIYGISVIRVLEEKKSLLLNKPSIKNFSTIRKLNHSYLAISFFQVTRRITCLQLEGRPALPVTQHWRMLHPPKGASTTRIIQNNHFQSTDTLAI